ERLPVERPANRVAEGAAQAVETFLVAQGRAELAEPGAGLDRGHGCNTTLIAPSSFCWKARYAAGASESGTRWVTRSSTPKGSSSSRSGRMSSTQRLTFA